MSLEGMTAAAEAQQNNTKLYYQLKNKLYAPDIIHDTEMISDEESLELISCDDDLYIAYIPDCTSKREVLFYCDAEGLIPVLYRTRNGHGIKMKKDLTEYDLAILADSYNIHSRSAAALEENYSEQIDDYVDRVKKKVEELIYA